MDQKPEFKKKKTFTLPNHP